LSKFQEYLKNTKNDPIEKQNIDSGKTFLFKNVLNLVRVLQGINFVGVLLAKSKSKSDPAKEQSIDFNETPLLENVLNLTGVPQGTNSIRVLSIKNES